MSREAILSALGGDDVFDDLLSLRDVQSVWPAVSPREWVMLQDKYIRPVVGAQVPLENILLLNQPLLAAVRRLMNDIPTYRLLNTLGWMFAYSYSWILSKDFDDLQDYTSPTRGVTQGLEGNSFTYVICLAAVQEAFSVATMAPLFNTRLSALDRQEVASLLNASVEQLGSIVRASEGASNATRTEFSAKIDAFSHRRLLPLKLIEDVEVIDSLYASFPSPDTVHDFYQSWLESRKALRAKLTPGFSGDVLTAKPRWYAAEIVYAYSMNLMFIGLVTILPPSYSWHGSRVMTYAGLGFQFARQLVKSMDQRGRLVRHSGEKANWWAHEQLCKFDRAESPKYKAYIRDLFALTVALSTMKNVSTVDASPLRLKLLEDWTSEQTFYVSYCSHFCGQYGARDMCDLAMNASEFRKAFKCQVRISDDNSCLFV
ncbi:neprilysin-11-like [Haemaphysalis longicornis]